MYLKLLNAPAATPISLSETKAHLRVIHNDEDSLILSLIDAATHYLDGRDGILGRALVTQQWEVRLDSFYYAIELPLPPLQSVDQVSYIAEDGTEQSVASEVYEVDTGSLIGQVREKFDQFWPAVQTSADAVRIQFTAGYGEAGDVPAPLKQALLLLVGHFYMHREAVSEASFSSLPIAVDSLITPYRFQVC